MGDTFGMDVEEIERQVVRLIQTGTIQARVDSRNKVWRLSPCLLFPQPSVLYYFFQILQARNQDPRIATLSMALATGKRIQETNRKLLFRMKL
jgi:COP9 signalosome complex subunit 1